MSVMQACTRRKAVQSEGHERKGAEQLSCVLACMLVTLAHGMVLSLLLTCTEQDVALCDCRC